MDCYSNRKSSRVNEAVEGSNLAEVVFSMRNRGVAIVRYETMVNLIQLDGFE
jgi:hypothetical protein